MAEPGLDTAVTSQQPPAAPAAMGPDPYADHAAILDLVQRKMREWGKGREGLLRAAWRNILFFRGHQWIRFDVSSNRFRPARLKANTPTPVDNKFASTMGAVISVYARIEPKMNYRPGTAEPQDRAAADVSSRAIQVVEGETSIRTVRQMLAVWVGLTGQAWLENGYDPDPRHGTRLIQDEQCAMCQHTQAPSDPQRCAQCGGSLLAPAVGENLEPVGQQVPVGKMYSDVATIFEMYFDAAQTEWSKQRGCIREKGVSLDEAKARWPEFADQITPDATTSGEMYQQSLPMLAGYIDGQQSARGLGFGVGQSGQVQNTRVTEWWFWHLPSQDYPDGLLAIVVGKQHVVYAGALPYRALQADGNTQPFLPFVYFPQQLVPGTAYAKTVADDLAVLQSRMNRLDAMVELTLMRTANPVWLIPEGSNVSNLTGDPGQMIRYNALGPTPAKPERIAGQGIPSGVMNERERISASFDDLAATFEVIRGQRPEGVSAGIALQILQERAMSRFGPQFILWEAAWAQWAQQQIEIFRQFATEERLLKIQGRDGAWQVKKFVGADLQGRVDVIAEAGSSMPRSTLLDRAEIEQLIALGIVNIADPEIRFAVLEIYGRTNLTPSMAADAKNAIMEDEAWAMLAQDPRMAAIGPQMAPMLEAVAAGAIGFNQLADMLAPYGLKLPKVRPAVDDHAIHSREHGETLKGEASHAWPEVIQALAEAHKAEHDRLSAIQMQAAMQASAGSNPTAGFLNNPGGGGGQMRSPQNGPSSGKRMVGDQREMEQTGAMEA